MNIDISAFKLYANANLQSKTNLILNSDGNGLTTTKARGGVNMLAGLLNIGTRAQYGRDTLDALKTALKSEFKAQNKLSDQECDAFVNQAFMEAVGKDFDKARAKAIKLNPQSLRKILDAADKMIADNLGTKAVDLKDASTLSIDKAVAKVQNFEITGRHQYGIGFQGLMSLVPKIRTDLNTEVVTKDSAKWIVMRLKDFAHSINTMKAPGGLKLGDVNPMFVSDENRLPKMQDLLDDLMTRIENRVNYLESTFHLND